MKLIIAGGRDFNDYWLLCYKLDRLLVNTKKEDILIIGGGASGADTLGIDYAKERGIAWIIEEAQWTLPNSKKDYAAGHKRNCKMAAMATHLVAFWNGRSSGTRDMISIAKCLKLNVRVVMYDIITG